MDVTLHCIKLVVGIKYRPIHAQVCFLKLMKIRNYDSISHSIPYINIYVIFHLFLNNDILT